jgi:hypothetical protein
MKLTCTIQNPMKTPPKKMEWFRRRRLRLRLAGLTCRGTPRRLRIWPKHLFSNCRTEAEKKIVRQRIYRQERMQRGLTHDGHPRRNYTWPELDGLAPHDRMNERIRRWRRNRDRQLKLTPLGIAWRKLRSTISVGVHISDVWNEQLPGRKEIYA